MEAAPTLPFTFAQQYGVLLQPSDPLVILHRDCLPLSVLTELRRFLGQPFELEAVADKEFQRRLTLAYQRNNNEASQVAEDLSADIDLSRLADEIPEMGDGARTKGP